MATQIKPTPVLKGEDAIRFFERIEKRKKATQEEKQQMNAGSERIKQMLTFKF